MAANLSAQTVGRGLQQSTQRVPGGVECYDNFESELLDKTEEAALEW